MRLHCFRRIAGLDKVGCRSRSQPLKPLHKYTFSTSSSAFCDVTLTTWKTPLQPPRAFADRLLFPAETRPGRRQGTPPTTSRASPSLPYFCLFFAMAISPFRCICGAHYSLSKDRGAPAPSPLGKISDHSPSWCAFISSCCFSSTYLLVFSFL